MDTATGLVVIEDVGPDEVWALVSDVTRTGEWSPENTGGRWVGGATGPVEGARFVGSNRNGIFRWWTTCTVIASVPGRRFAFDVAAGPLPVARWDWETAPYGESGSELRLSWTDRRTGPLGWAMRRGGRIAVGATIDRAHVQANIDTSLSRLRDRFTRM
ncbi:MAG: SRPBCC family protein [Actinomycetes bacterium]